MKSGYIVENILHSGRKGPRFEERNEHKYYGLKGFTVEFCIEDLKGGQPMYWIVKDSPIYDWWNTTAVLEAYHVEGMLIIETINTIYLLRELVTVTPPTVEKLMKYEEYLKS